MVLAKTFETKGGVCGLGGQLVSAPPLFARFPSSGRDSSTRESGDGRDLLVVSELRKFSRWSAEGQRPFRPSREMGLSSGCDTRTVPLAKSRCPTPQLALRSLVLVAREKIPGDVEPPQIGVFRLSTPQRASHGRMSRLPDPAITLPQLPESRTERLATGGSNAVRTRMSWSGMES